MEFAFWCGIQTNFTCQIKKEEDFNSDKGMKEGETAWGLEGALNWSIKE